MTYDPERRATYALPPGLKQAIRTQALQEGMNPNQWVVQTLLAALNPPTPNPPAAGGGGA